MAKKITLKSRDGETFELEHAVALESQMIKHMIEGDCPDDIEIPVPNITGMVLAKVIEYCKKHVEAMNFDDNDLNKWDEDFIKVHEDKYFDLMFAADYLDIKSLCDLISKTFADMIPQWD